MSKQIQIIYYILFLLLLSSCNDLPEPYVEVPFDISTKGATSILEFEIKKEFKYPFILSIQWDAKNFKTKFKTKEYRTKKERKEAFTKAYDKNIKLIIEKIEKNNNNIIMNKKFLDYPLYSHDYSTAVESYFITMIKLSPGLYRASITSLDDIEVYKRDDILVTFAITQPRRK